jgi:hypothetical protein
MLIFPSQLSKRGQYSRTMGNETLIKVSKSKRTLDISNKNWSNLVHDGMNLT